MNTLKKILPKLWLPIFFLLVMWAVECTEWLLHVSFSQYGTYPRDISRIAGVIFTPFLHGSWRHIGNNSTPFIVLSAILFLLYRPVAYRVFFMNYFITGLAVWALARGGTVHIGASGLVFGLFGFVFMSGLFRMDIKSMGISLAVGFFYGGMLMGVLPGQPGISWESHLFGAIAGGTLAWYFRNVNKVEPPSFMEEKDEANSFQDFIEKYDSKY